jgi:hypothetical protein
MFVKGLDCVKNPVTATTRVPHIWASVSLRLQVKSMLGFGRTSSLWSYTRFM